MKTIQLMMVFIAALFASTIQAHDTDTSTFSQAAHYRFGDSREALIAVEHIVQDALNDVIDKGTIERDLITLFEEDETATPDARQFACRQLALIGTEECVPALANALDDPSLSDMARYALERIASPKANDALRRALKKSTPETRIGLINSVGVRMDVKSIPTLAQFLTESDDVAKAAARALGNIGTGDAYYTLLSAKNNASLSNEVRAAAVEGILACAYEAITCDICRSQIDPVEIFTLLNTSEQPEQVRAAAIGGLLKSDPAKGNQAILNALTSDITTQNNYRMAALATGFIRTSHETEMFASKLDQLAPPVQALLICALADKGATETYQRIAPFALPGKAKDLRLAALYAASMIGNEKSLEGILWGVVDNEPEIADAAVNALNRIPDRQIDTIIINILSGISKMDAATLASKIKDRAVAEDSIIKGVNTMISALATRRAQNATTALTHVAQNNPEKKIRTESYKALSVLGTPDDVAPLINLIISIKDEGERAVMEKSLGDVCNRIEDPAQRLTPLENAFNAESNLEIKMALLRVMGRLGTPQALAVIAREIQNPQLKETAIRILGDWPDGSALEVLRPLAQDSSLDEKLRVLALRGYIHAIDITPTTGEENKFLLYADAMNWTQRTADRRLILKGLAAAEDPRVFPLIRSYLDDPELRPDAIQALLDYAKTILPSFPDFARMIAKTVQSNSEGAVQEQAVRIIDETAKYGDYLFTWLVSPVYESSFDAAFDTVFEAESNPNNVEWTPLRNAVSDAVYMVDLGQTPLMGDNRVIYFKTLVFIPEAQEAKIFMGSDDGCKVWLNGELVHSLGGPRALSKDGDQFNVKLKAGENEILVKVIQGGGQWQLSMRIANPDGSVIENKLP